ncbi:MAG: metallophosphoesterase [Taibaiella sp.]|nr:metallophosphoesterase [Taibaiella sp.]
MRRSLLIIAVAFAVSVSRAQQNNPSFLVISDIHLDTESPATQPWHDPGMDLWKAFQRKATEVAKQEDVQFILFLGDLPAHYSCIGGCYLAPGKRFQHNENISQALSGLHGIAARSGKPLFYLPGNNDAISGNYYSFADQRGQTPISLAQASPLFFPAIVPSTNTTPPCLVSNPNARLGYYAAYPVAGIRLIALNTVIYSPKYESADGISQQAAGDEQMTWLAGQLEEATSKKEKVFLAMHIPPGVDYKKNAMWSNAQPWERQLLALCTKYQSTIAGILFGHTHMDELRRLYDTTGQYVTEVAIAAPGLSPNHRTNPAIKTVSFDPKSKELLDFTTYYTKSYTTWSTDSYTFSNMYKSSPKQTIYDAVKAMPIDTLRKRMQPVYSVKNNPFIFNSSGIEVKP